MLLDRLITGRRALLLTGLGIVAILGVIGSIRWQLPETVMTSQLRQAIERNTGYAIETFGELHFTALPWPTVQITDLSMRKRGSPSESVETQLLKARISVAAWLRGEPKVVSLVLFDPVLRLASNLKIGETEALSSAVLSFLRSETRPELRSLRIQRGTVYLDGAPWMQNLSFTLSDVATSELRVQIEGDYRAVPVRLAAEIAHGASRDRRMISWSLSTPALDARFAGQLYGPASLDAEGRFTLAVRDGPATAPRRFPQAAPLLTGLELTGRTRVTWPLIQIREAVLTRGDDRFDGSVEFSVDARQPTLSATLHTARLDIVPILQPVFSLLAANSGGWGSLTTLAGALQPGQLDVRLSADRLILGANIIEGAALSAEAANRRFELMLNEGRLRSGSLKGRIAVTARTPGEIDVKGHASLERIEALTILEPFGVTRIRGQTTGALMLTGSGSSLPQLMETLEGRASVTVREGEIGGVDVDRIVSRGIVSALAMEGRTRFQSLVMQMRIGNGVATLHDSIITTLTSSAPLEGTINLSRQTSDVTARILPGGDPGRAMDTRLRIQGSWAKPVLMPDVVNRGGRS
ncbi:MAG: AsmA family protein [Methylocystis sp.]|nr:AsmA family protein [Methylocystis sp.]MCA3587144.1 AsmA family protein [Methylocystis sp.]MCA3590578.1 AsmA family protein [Methylocystis sp.]